MSSLKPKIYEKFKTISDFCREVDIGENRMSKIITGRAIPKPEEIKVILETLGLDPEEIKG